MSETDAPLSMIDEAAVAAAELRHDPYDYTYIEEALPARLKDEVLADAPVIPDRGSYGLPDLVRGPRFDAVIKDLLSAALPPSGGREIRHRPEQPAALHRHDGQHLGQL